MEDRELLELAAKAAGLDTGHKWNDQRLKMTPPVVGLVVHRNGELVSTGWNPLNNDGDALRLAMRLGICIQFIPECDTVQVYQEREFTAERFNVHVAALGDIETRLVITQAAAEIGKAMQEKH